MKTQFNSSDKIIVQIILNDVISATYRAGDRSTRRHAERIINKFDISSLYTYISASECLMLLGLVRKFKQIAKIEMEKNQNDDKADLEIANKNMESVELLDIKLANLIKKFQDNREHSVTRD